MPRFKPIVGEIVEVVWLGKTRATLKVAKIHQTHFECDDGSRWFFYGRPYSEEPWGVRLRFPMSAGEKED